MEKQKTTFIPWLLKLSVLMFFLLLFTSFGSFKKAYANQMFEITAQNYEAGTWATENVVITAAVHPDFEGGQIFYSLDGGYTFSLFDKQFVVETEGENFIIFKFEFTNQGGIVLEEETDIEIKIDKTNPILDRIELSEENFTTEPVSVKIFLADSSIYKEEYRATIFEQTYFPLPQNLAQGQIAFEFVTERNTVLNVGDIIFYDQAGNKTIYNEEIVINNIDNQVPDFHLNILNGKNKSEKQIEIKLGYIHSQAKEIIFISPSGQVKSLPIIAEQKITIKENGTYIVKVVSHAELVFSRGVIIKEISPPNLIVLWFTFFVISLSGVGITFIILFLNKKRYIKNY